MPVYKVDFDNNVPIAAAEVPGKQYATLKSFERIGARTTIKWFILQAPDEKNAVQMAAKLVRQIWGHLLFSPDSRP